MGPGKHAVTKILPSLRNAKYINLIGVYSRNISIMESIKKNYGCKCWHNEKDLLNDINVDTIYLATPNGLHYEQGRLILTYNKNLLCEKSITTDLNNTTELVKIAKARNLLLYETFMYLHHPQFITLKEILVCGKYGKIQHVDAKFCIPKLKDPGFRYKTNLGGGALWDMACYPVSFAVQLIKNINKVNLEYLDTKRENKINIGGLAVFSYCKNYKYVFKWAYESSYINIINIVTDKISLSAKNIFSHKINKLSNIKLYNNNGIKKLIKIPQNNSFTSMLNYLGECKESKEKKLSMYKNITHQAKLMNILRIRDEKLERN